MGSPAMPADASYESEAFVALEADGSAWTIVLVAIGTDFITEGSTFLPAIRACVTDLWSYDIRVLPANTVNIAWCSINDVSNCWWDTWGYSLNNLCCLSCLLGGCKLSFFSDCNAVSESNCSCEDSFVDEWVHCFVWELFVCGIELYNELLAYIEVWAITWCTAK